MSAQPEISPLSRLIIEASSPDPPLNGDSIVPLLGQIGIINNFLTHVVNIGRNRFLIESRQQLRTYEGNIYNTLLGISMCCTRVKPKRLTLNVFGSDIDWDEETIIESLKPYLGGYEEMRFGTLRNFPEIRNGVRHIKFKEIKGDMPKSIKIKGRIITISG